jgi:hypothetical protein
VQCPICTQPLEGGELVMVCNSCHKGLGGGLSVGATGEFRVPSPELLAATGAVEPGEKPAVTGSCSWCGKDESTVKKLIGRGNASLCNECVSLACDIMDAELGSGWR